MLARPPQASQSMSRRRSARQSNTTTESRSYKDLTESSEPSHETPSVFLTGHDRISDADHVRLLNRLDSMNQPFRVEIVPLSLERRESGTLLDVQDDLFEERLAVEYKVESRKG